MSGGRARRAQADVAVPRSELGTFGKNRAIRYELWLELSKLGTPDPNTLKFGRDPSDSPLADQGYPNDEVAVIRASALVVPK